MTDVKSGAVNIDLALERQRAQVSSEEFAEWWAGGCAALEKRRQLDNFFFDDSQFDDPIPVSYLSHKELYENSIKKGAALVRKLREHFKRDEAEQLKRGTKQDPAAAVFKYREVLCGHLGSALLPQGNSIRLHFTMFLPTLLNQGTEEQQRLWLDKALNIQGVIGTYAQTELGHGTFLRGLQTRAEYDVEKEEFVLNMPTLTAFKWWPGGLGHTVNMAVVMAQLYIKGKHYGMQPFLVQLRHPETHVPMPGVEIGEIGTKMGWGGVNNGFLGLRNVRIPRTQMLMKINQVLPDGTFVKGRFPLMTYGTMVYVRVGIVKDVALGLLQAATIATRYSAVRRQSPIDPNQPEPQIMDHITQQEKLFPQIAKGVFFKIAGDFAWKRYDAVMKELEGGNQRHLPEIHGLSCCLKATCSQQGSEGIEILRKACGGQGFLTSANFSNLYQTFTAACTYEGENTVLHLQSARFLVKSFLEGIKRKYLPPTVAYLRGSGRPTLSDDLKSLVSVMEFTSLGKTRTAFDYLGMKRRQTPNRVEAVATNKASIKLVQASVMHGKTILVRIAYNEVQRLTGSVPPSVEKILHQLLEIFILNSFLASLSDILQYYPLSSAKIEKLEIRYQKALADFRPNAVAIVDGFDFHDRVLNSTLGAYDGRVYERLMEEAKKSPLNKEVVNETFEKYLKPLMQAKL